MSKMVMLGLLCASSMALGACERQGPFSQAGEAVDDAVDTARDRAEDLHDEAEELVEEARGD